MIPFPSLSTDPQPGSLRLLTDSHCHLQDPAFAADLPQLLDRAALFGIRRFVVNGTHPGDWHAVASLTEGRPGIRPQFGVHPWKAEALPADWEAQLERWLLRFPVAGLGEAGLDGSRRVPAMDRQIPVLEKQLELARRLQRPCTLHVVNAWPEIQQVLAGQPGLRFLLHSYSGSAELVAAFLKRDAYFSFGGALLRQPLPPKRLAALRAVPVERLLLETDAPFQHPGGKDRRQEPAGLLKIAEAAAEIRGDRLDRLLPVLEANVQRFFEG